MFLGCDGTQLVDKVLCLLLFFFWTVLSLCANALQYTYCHGNSGIHFCFRTEVVLSENSPLKLMN